MGIFDFLKKNKNIENDNGLNEIYYDDGKGLISKSYHLKNGLKCGLYQEWFHDPDFFFFKILINFSVLID